MDAINEIIPKLTISPKDNKNEVTYVSGEILSLLGLPSNPEIFEDDHTELKLNGITVPGEKLSQIFDRITLSREKSKPKDIHGRYDQSNIDWDNKIPDVSKFIDSINKDIETKFGFKKRSEEKFKVIFTHDIDWVSGRELASIIKSLKVILELGRKSWLPLSEAMRKNVFLECYTQMMDIEKSYGVSTWNFMLSGPHGRGRYSTRYDIKWEPARKLIEIILDSGNMIGLHGSYDAPENNSYKIEASTLEKVIGKPVIAHRNHYLRFNPDKFWSQLENAGIEYDFSIGFTSNAGFRSGMATSYYPYNFGSKSAAKVREIPLVYMERLSHLDNEEETLAELENILNEAKKYNGCVSILFHPETFAIDKKWFSYYEKVIKLALSLDADVSGNLPSDEKQ